MHIHVGPYKYSIEIAEPVDHPGEPAEWNWWERVIRISPDTPRERRVHVLRHEYAHVWEFEMGLPDGPESRAQAHAAMAEMFDAELARLGGRWAIMNLEPDGQVHHGAAGAAGGVDRAYAAHCAQCEAPIMQASIANAAPIYDPDAGGLVLRRALYCEHCNLTTAWRELATATGLPTGRVIGQPALLRGDQRQLPRPEGRSLFLY